MKKRGLILGLATLMLLCSCGATYQNESSSEKDGIKTEAVSALSLGKDTFKLTKTEVTSYNKEAASKNGVSDAYTIKTVATYAGSMTTEESLLGSDTVYVLSYESYKYQYKVTGSGASEWKGKAEPVLKVLFSSQEVVDLLNGKTITKEGSGTTKVKVNEEDKSFTYTLGIL